MELKQYLKMSQQLVMTPQLQQAIRLLQLSRTELMEAVQQELVENPVLEEDGDPASGDPLATSTGSDNGDRTSQGEATPSGEGGEESAAAEGNGAEDPVERDWEQYLSAYSDYADTPGGDGVRYDDEDAPTLEQTLASHDNLYEQLRAQLGVTLLTDAERELADRVVGNLDPEGYLPPEMLQALAEEVGLDVEEAEAVLGVVQQLDPLGVAARDLRECLLVQAHHHYPDDEVLHGLIDRHLENLEKRRVQPIVDDLGIDRERLREAMDRVATLEPKPGRSYTTEETRYITPDVYVVKVGDDYVVQLNEDGLPKLRLSNFYEQQIRSGEADREAREFIHERFRSAVWLIRSIHQRQQTIRRVTESIVTFQRDFLDKGIEYLRPLILRDVAEDIGMHESTISRVTTNKYVHTPQGLFELKYFFNSRIARERGPDVASESVKQWIRRTIAEEDPRKPYSDQAICRMLSEQGLEIARRTVAKYREMLGIAPSSKRKRLV